MTGTERLREIAGMKYIGMPSPVRCALLSVADQIERECACDADTIENVRLIVGGVIDEMERHVSGHEGAEDSPVARWARELRDALKSDTSDSADAQSPSWHDPADAAGVTSEAAKVTRDPAEDFSMSAYDLLPQEDREAIAWVREHGGLDHVKAEWRSRVPYERYVRRRQSLLGHIAECETALGRRREIIPKLGHRVSDLTRENAELRKRAMPEGMEWPRFDDEEPVRIGDEFMGKDGKTYTVKQVQLIGKFYALYDFCDAKPQFVASYGERVKRPAPKVLDADGAEIRVGDTVWKVGTVLAIPMTVVEVSSDTVRCEYTWTDGKVYRPCCSPDTLIHTKPEPVDTWQRIEEDARKDAREYCEDADLVAAYMGSEAEVHAMARDLVRRCKALAERERGE